MNHNNSVADRALVLGGSMAGLLAARVLAERFATVTVVDRDDLHRGPTHRRGVPQDRHINALLARGQQVLEELFPGLTAELEAQGVPTGDMLADTRIFLNGHRLRRATTGLRLVSASRPLLEERVRRRVRALDNVTFAPSSDVLGLVATPDRRRVTGARLLRRADNSAQEMLSADLVIDATGRGSRAHAWLEALGYQPPEDEEVRIDLGYATRRYKQRPHDANGDVAILMGPSPDQPRGAVLARLEDDQWILTLAGMIGDHPPTDPDGFDDFARSLPFGVIHETIADAEPCDDPVAYRFPANVRRRYERLPRVPAGFVPLGDSIASFNPLYGQGITVAALQALCLRRHLHDLGARPDELIRDIADVIDMPWELATGADLAFREVAGPRTSKTRMANAYMPRLHAAAEHDPELARAFVRVMGLVDDPNSLLQPGVVLRVLRHGLRRRVATPTHRR